MTPFAFSFSMNPMPMLTGPAERNFDLDVDPVGGDNMADQHDDSENPYERCSAPSVEEPKSEPECDDSV